MTTIIITAIVSVIATLGVLYRCGRLSARHSHNQNDYEDELLFFTCWDPVSDENRKKRQAS